MKVLLVHNQYQQSGGEDLVFKNELELLKNNGVNVHTHVAHSDSIKTVTDKFKVALDLAYSKEQKERLALKIAEVKPDLVHVHNFFPILTPSIFDATFETNTPSILSLHNFRAFCANGLFLRNNQVCELCLNGSAYRSVQYGCYRKSAIATLPVAHMIESHRKKGTWKTKVNKFIALSEFGRKKFVQGGFPENKIVIKPNFSNDPFSSASLPTKKMQDGFALYMGRLSEEKGILSLIEAWKQINFKLYIAGDGPLKAEIEKTKPANVQLLGYVDREKKAELLKSADFLVIPSECYEGFPVVLAEAFSFGLPILASKIGALKELVTHEITGLHFEPKNRDDLANQVKRLIASTDLLQKMSFECRRTYEKNYTPELNLKTLLEIYEQTIKDSNRR